MSPSAKSGMEAVIAVNKVDDEQCGDRPDTARMVSDDYHASMAKLWIKMDLLVLPVVTTMYFLFSLDRFNIGNARIAGMQKQLHITDRQYSIALSAQIIPQMIIQIPSNHLIVVVGPRILLPAMILLGGVACTLHGVVSSYTGLVVCRFLLGLFQGGILPGVHLYLASFYPRRMLQLRISIMHSALALASSFSGLLAAAIVHMDGVGGRPGWAWVFILEGMFIVLVSVASVFLLPNSPTSALFFSDEEKGRIADALRDDGILVQGDRRGRFWKEFGRIFIQPHVMLLVLADLFYDSTISSLGFFLPSIVAGLGFEAAKAQLMTVPPFALSVLLGIITAILADRYAARGLTMTFMASMSTIGFAMFLVSFANGVRYGSLFLAVPGVFCIGPSLTTWMANNTAPLVRRATALAMTTTIRNVGAILSMWLFGPLSPPPRYTAATATLLAFQGGTVLCAVCTMVFVAVENRRKERHRDAYSRENPDATTRMTAEREIPLRNESIWFEYVM